ncbi:MAG: hypothetical protein AAFQ82_14765, partial [Myxococcota bacterium]
RDNLESEMRIEAYLLKGSVLAILGDPVAAERPFRRLILLSPNYELADGTSPKIMGVFRKVQAEENAIREEARRFELARIIASLKVEGTAPERTQGGQPLEFQYKILDPQQSLDRVAIQYRREGDLAFSSLALQLDKQGFWRGTIPGEWTASPQGFVFQYFLSSFAADSTPLIQSGSSSEPLELSIEAGEVDQGPPFYRTFWFWSAVGAAVVATGIATYIAVEDARSLPDSDLTFRF